MNEDLQRNAEAVLTGADGIPLDEIDSRLEELLKAANAKGNYDTIADEIYRLREVKQNTLVSGAEREGMKQRISEMQQFLSEQTQEVTEYDEQLICRMIEKITVYDGGLIREYLLQLAPCRNAGCFLLQKVHRQFIWAYCNFENYII